MRRALKKMDNLPENVKAIICDNCENNDNCSKSYTGFFNNVMCYETWKAIRDELEEEENEME